MQVPNQQQLGADSDPPNTQAKNINAQVPGDSGQMHPQSQPPHVLRLGGSMGSAAEKPHTSELEEGVEPRKPQVASMACRLSDAAVTRF